MFKFKPKKVFEKLNKMDRKQAYTIGAIVAVSVVALLMLISLSGTDDSSFQGFDSRGYDLADMKFATDAAEKYLLAAKYPDMQDNGSTLLYSKAEKEARQEADAQAAQEEQETATNAGAESSSGSGGVAIQGHGYGGYRVGARGGGKTEVGQLSTTGMASSGGSGINTNYGPSGDFRQFKSREDKGLGPQTPLAIRQNKEAAAFRTASLQAARSRENKLTAARKAVQQLSVDGQNPTTTAPTIDPTGGFSISGDDVPVTTDLDNLDKAVENAAKDAQKKNDDDKKDDKLGFWEQLGQDLLRQAATTLVNSFMSGIGDTIKDGFSANSASRSARKGKASSLAGGDWDSLSASDQAYLKSKGINSSNWNDKSYKDRYNALKHAPSPSVAGKNAKSSYYGNDTDDNVIQYGQGSGGGNRGGSSGGGNRGGSSSGQRSASCPIGYHRGSDGSCQLNMYSI